MRKADEKRTKKCGTPQGSAAKGGSSLVYFARCSLLFFVGKIEVIGGIDAFAVERKLEVKVRAAVCLRAVRGGDRAENVALFKLIARLQPFLGLYEAV